MINPISVEQAIRLFDDANNWIQNIKSIPEESEFRKIAINYAQEIKIAINTDIVQELCTEIFRVIAEEHVKKLND